MNKKIRIAIIIPVYNEERIIGSLIEKLKKLYSNYEIIIVDDGSTDNTLKIVKQFDVKIIRHPRNIGYGGALKTGIRSVKADIIVLMDADGQHNPEDINKLLEHIDDYDMVVGARSEDSQTSHFRRPFKRVLEWVANYLSGIKIPDLNSGFRAVRRKHVLDYIHILPNTFSFSTSITLAFIIAGLRVEYVSITTTKRVGRKSNVNFLRDGFNAVILIIRTIALFNPLRVFLPISIFLILTGTIYQLFIFTKEFHIVAGALLSIISGIFIFFFGILADQISMIRRSK